MAPEPIAHALNKLLSAVTTVGEIALPILEARGLINAHDVIAQHDLPGFDNSAMDGYAVRASDVAVVGTTLPVIGESRAGGAWPQPLTSRSAMRIFTGAPMPRDADSVIIQENATRNGEMVTFSVSPRPLANVRRQGSDLTRGALCLAADSAIEAGEISMLAGQGYARVMVHRRPRVAIVSTGDELRELDQALTAGTLFNSNSYMLAAAVQSAGAQPWVLPIARDDADSIATTFAKAFEADMVLCCGGVSVGDYDFVAAALKQLGVQTHFHKVAMKPGKPLLFATRQQVPFLGLPGNPVSAWVAFEVFVRPCLRKMLGHRRVHTRSVNVSLAATTRHSVGRIELARARFEVDGDRIVAHLVAQQGSGSLPSLTNVDGLVILPADQEHFVAGEPLRALVLHETRGHDTCAFT